MSVAVTLTNKYDDGASPPAAVVVVPSLDLNLGTVLFRANGVFEERWHPDPRRLEAVLARAVQPVRWDPTGQSLEVGVAAVGHSEGKVVRIPLLEHAIPCNIERPKPPSRAEIPSIPG